VPIVRIRKFFYAILLLAGPAKYPAVKPWATIAHGVYDTGSSMTIYYYEPHCIACNLRHVLQFTGLLSVSFALNFPISLSRAIRNPFRSNVQCPPAKHGLSRISANPLITLLSDAWRNDVASGAESRCITRPMRCLVADGNNRVWHARV